MFATGEQCAPLLRRRKNVDVGIPYASHGAHSCDTPRQHQEAYRVPLNVIPKRNFYSTLITSFCHSEVIMKGCHHPRRTWTDKRWRYFISPFQCCHFHLIQALIVSDFLFLFKKYTRCTEGLINEVKEPSFSTDTFQIPIQINALDYCL